VNNRIFVLLGLGLFVAACSDSNKGDSTKSQGWQPQINQPSELASIMRVLHNEATERKATLEDGYMAVVNSKLIFKMINAKPTEPHMIGQAFEPSAQAFMASYGQLSATDDVQGQIKAHNNLVKSCVACHMNFCQGPIPRIEKLYVK
tara:strand:+ start:57 stop:497 length:441 start_codon:yes stop_codon:yes gene_type:complete